MTAFPLPSFLTSTPSQSSSVMLTSSIARCGGCEEIGVQGCVCTYESGECSGSQCGSYYQGCHEWTDCFEDCDESCSEDCGEDCLESPIDVDYWDWESSNGAASANRTQTAYEAVLNCGAVNDFHYLVWNDLVDKIYEVKQYAGFNWNARYDSYENTRMTATDKILTALRFNSARYNIGVHVSTGIQEVDPGDDVMGDYFITIADCINAYIDQLA